MSDDMRRLRGWDLRERESRPQRWAFAVQSYLEIHGVKLKGKPASTTLSIKNIALEPVKHPFWKVKKTYYSYEEYPK